MPKDLTAAAILNRTLPSRPWLLPRAQLLPGISPIDPAEWIWVLDSYAAQMAEKARLLADLPTKVHAMLPQAMEPAQELLELVLAQLRERPDFRRDGEIVQCPDGRAVALDREAPLVTLARLVQEDLCLLQRPEGAEEHVLTGAILGFPASWTLAEKLGRPMWAIHSPVATYDRDLARRVQRLLDGVRPGRPLTRCNAHLYDDPALFQPRPESDPRPAGAADAGFFRSERQCLLRLPRTGAVVFSIHTIVMRRQDLTPEDLAVLKIGSREKRRTGSRSSP